MSTYSGYQYLAYLHRIAWQELRGQRTPSLMFSLVAAMILFGTLCGAGANLMSRGYAREVLIWAGVISVAVSALNFIALLRVVTIWRDACYWFYLDTFAATDMLLQVFEHEWPESLEYIQPRAGGRAMLVNTSPRELVRHHNLRQRIDYLRAHYVKISRALGLRPSPTRLPWTNGLIFGILLGFLLFFLIAIAITPGSWSVAAGLLMLFPAAVIAGGYQSIRKAVVRHAFDLAIADAILGPGPAELEDGHYSYHIAPEEHSSLV